MTIVERLKQGITTESAEQTRVLAAELAAALPPDTTLALHGDMGVGKTTFVQGLAQGLGVPEHVTSPTFAIYSVYQGKGRKLVHLDAYRLEKEAQLEALLLDEFLVSPYVLAVEWPEKTGAWLPKDAWHLTLSIVDGDKHRLVLL
ncbi:tRNA (adenosine(37)-N6)-threonylcarbamoyltransferase complex ATPase subunit type 1 TsaE [Opitutus sp. GAS368]|jgi:tRNA threonylcarbamoyladenosine biosynthesis protein TsaE|uniref:tRNA (adenosine(37)-N6)-threonylcarbamoyltransferase complex ATPase subunit type 1 TsaE n=1 Tax=Opitutus sp. GAS368 TaxID=1882749 RepID=UPI00087AD750|nr:tRNA (adenosine(37)-N6)-threonylcarbamoyltransferase complex ATPase subunit type 1 TsaE [Opitutus sp. GAS368]SDR65754.1 tRNA threonylcarbamoyladenosine biosynthesis protein TsaE [Opitutus sp. GAS368]